MSLLIAGCGSAPTRPPLPPSASDLLLLEPARLCDPRTAVLAAARRQGGESVPWGAGQEIRFPATRTSSGGAESLLFDEDGTLIGALFFFPQGLSLRDYPVLRETLSQLQPTVEFYLGLTEAPPRSDQHTSRLYLTGKQTTTHQYLVTGSGKTSRLLIASLAVDPYAMLLSPYRDEYFARLGLGARNPSSSPAGVAGVKGADDESLLVRQQFARGQTAQLGYCGTRDYDKAVGAYERALAVGFRDPVWTAEAHHRLGLALQGSGAYARAKTEMEQALALRPNVPEVLNNLGTVYAKLGDRKHAIAAFEQAVTLRPNYYLARYNLAESYEPLDPKRAVMEYETYLALVEGIPEEEERAAAARERLKALKR